MHSKQKLAMQQLLSYMSKNFGMCVNRSAEINYHCINKNFPMNAGTVISLYMFKTTNSKTLMFLVSPCSWLCPTIEARYKGAAPTGGGIITSHIHQSHCITSACAKINEGFAKPLMKLENAWPNPDFNGDTWKPQAMRIEAKADKGCPKPSFKSYFCHN